jgi:large subunit ribosomal protein L23
MQEKIFNIVKRPVVSEKSTALAELANRYVFEVAYEATKPEIRDAVEQLFKVKVKAVRTIVMHGKNKRSGKFEYKRSNWKKAIITLSEGQRIELFQVKQ